MDSSNWVFNATRREPSMNQGGPTTDLSSPLADGLELESQLCALGQVGLVKHHRNVLKQELSKQRHISSAYRRLAFRLAAQLSARDERLKKQAKALADSRLAEYLKDRTRDDMIQQLSSTIDTYEAQGESLLQSLKKEDQSDDHTHKLPFSHPASLPSPPFSPSLPQISFDMGPILRLPTEVLKLCHARVDSLLSENRLNQHTVTLLRETEAALLKDLHENAKELQALQQQQEQSDYELDSTKAELSKLREELENSQARVQELEYSKAKTEYMISKHENDILDLQKARQEQESKLGFVNVDLSELEKELQDAQTKIGLLEQPKAATIHLVRTYADHAEDDFGKHGHYQNGLEKLRNEYRQGQESIGRLLQHQAEFDRKKSDLEDQIEESRKAHNDFLLSLSSVESQLTTAKQDYRDIMDNIRAQQGTLQILQKSEQTLRETITRHEDVIPTLECSRDQLRKDAGFAHSLKENLANSATRLRKDLESQKYRGVSLEELDSLPQTDISIHEEKIRPLEGTIGNSEDNESVYVTGTEGSDSGNSSLGAAFRESTVILERSQADLSSKISSLQDSEALLKEELNTARSEIQDERLHSQILDNEKRHLQKHIATIEEEFEAAMASSIKEKKDLAKQIANLLNRLKKQTDELRQKDSSIGKLQIAHDSQIRERDLEIITLTTKVSTLRFANEEMVSQTKSAENELHYKSSALGSVFGKFRTVQKSASDSRKRADFLETLLRSKEEEIEALQTQNTVQNSSIRDLEVELHVLRADNDNLFSTLDTLKSQKRSRSSWRRRSSARMSTPNLVALPSIADSASLTMPQNRTTFYFDASSGDYDLQETDRRARRTKSLQRLSQAPRPSTSSGVEHMLHGVDSWNEPRMPFDPRTSFERRLAATETPYVGVDKAKAKSTENLARRTDDRALNGHRKLRRLMSWTKLA